MEWKRILDTLSDRIKGSLATSSGDAGVAQEYVDNMIKKLRDEIFELIGSLKEELDKKISFDDLWKSEALILEKLDEVAGALLKKLADKGDTKKALIYLEKKIN